MSLTDLEMVKFDVPKLNVHMTFRDKGRVQGVLHSEGN